MIPIPFAPETAGPKARESYDDGHALNVERVEDLHAGVRVWLYQIRDAELVHMVGAVGTVAGSTTHPDWPGIECRTVYFDRWPTRSGLPWGVRADDLRRLPG